MRLIVRDNTSKFDAVKVLVVALRERCDTGRRGEIPLRQTVDALRRLRRRECEDGRYRQDTLCR